MPTAASRAELEALLYADAPFGDLTTQALDLSGAGEMAFLARDPMIAALVEDAAALIELSGCKVEIVAPSGARLSRGAPILVARGSAAGLLRGWKVAQTLIEIWSGVASAAREIVDAARVAAPNVAVACTRKNVPGVKRFAVAAVHAGGAGMHRLGLSESILVFPQHRVFLKRETLSELATRLRRSAPEKTLTIEVDTLEEAFDAAQAGFDIVQAERFAPAEIAALITRLRRSGPRPVVAAAGGINARNAAAYAEAGADVLVTSAPYLASPRDVQVNFTQAV